MAFLGHIDNLGTMVSRELLSGGAAMNQPHQDDSETIEGSRTYIKTYDQGSLLQAMGSPSTVRYVGSSESSSEVNSLDETECSTLHRCLLQSQRTLLAEHEEYADDQGLDTGSETICLQLESPRSTSSNASCSSSSSSRGSDAQEKSSTTSMCSWEEAMSRGESMRHSSSQEETRDFSMPSLHLGSDRGSAPLTYTRRLHSQRLERPANEAYENWLSAKQQQAKYRRQAEQKNREEQQQRTELRQRLSQERYEQWCRQKAQQSHGTRSKQEQPSRTPPSKSKGTTTKTNLQQWELEKLRLAEQRRLQVEIAERRRQQENRQRQQQAENAFQRWMSHVDQRPKPVPSNQGINSLRGTISNLYINPNRWVN
ncbi:coiled-coil domain-containing protein 34 [Drosophila kikkawai]|uniref:Vicilin-like seed storage protein At2g18540 n=1 Tax=Drosophila kikkawai TaxID=30033 RepID=A0A6P4ID78_DROKI|nr:vicilin-like seed storage protein At2g18540 [Drosophila kikkawai]XP_017020811.1 vicilin-like seed storage protein At2g18540 [Drosophila kikkawai]